MTEAHSDLAGLAQMHRLDDVAQVRALWRRGIATLAAMASENEPVPLEGFSPSALLAGARIALNSGFFDDMDWLSPAHAAVAMYELASALPRSDERRELGRRVLTALYEGEAETFVALATALALGSSRGLDGPQVRAQVALSLYMPIGIGTRADGLALALISRRESEREWLSLPSMGSLPSRRLAARLLERAAHEAARRAAAGDDAGVHVFNKPSVSSAFRRLLADRESLVWRHVASARGLLSEAIPAYNDIIERNLSPELTPTEWRRAAASLTARIALEPDETLARCSQLMHSDVLARDRGIIAAMIFGLPCAADAERDAAEELLGGLIAAGDIFAIEALVDLRRERIGTEFGSRAAVRARALLRDDRDTGDDGMEALKVALYHELAPPGHRRGCLIHDRLVAALEAFAEGGAKAARSAADQVLEAAGETMLQLERARGDSSEDRRLAFRAVRELDRGLLETNSLSDLLTLRTSARDAIARLERLRARMTSWFLNQESEAVDSAQIEHLIWRMRRLRTLLHLVDADGSSADDAGLRERRLTTVRLLLGRVAGDVSSPLRRTVCAALARACDALVREEICELSDVFLAAAMDINSRTDLSILGEASMEPALKELLRTHVDLVRAVHAAIREEEDRDLDDEDDNGADLESCFDILRTMVDAVPTAQSPRVEALRSGLHRFSRALAAVNATRSLAALVESGRMGNLETGAQGLARLVTGVSRRLERVQGIDPPRSGAALRAAEAALQRAVRDDNHGLARVVSKAIRVLRGELPRALAELTALVLKRVLALPVTSTDGDDTVATSFAEPPRIAPWLPPARVLGGFYVLQTIGTGAVGSVFVARRVEERHDQSAETFALKVPEYNGTAAHTLSEGEFLRLFRQEAGALLMLPEHRNLARFVTFDAGARPKPILVMELVPGPTLERLLDREEFSMGQALAILDGIAAGLHAMHQVGVAHLDVKPSNIILRATQDAQTTPVLVDFGLAGRKLRPGCATVHYGAPEVWSTKPDPAFEPMPTDVYAFSCLAFELLTNEILFDGDTAVAIVSSHLEHRGPPEPLQKLARGDRLDGLVDVLYQGLRNKPDERSSIDEIRAGLAELAPALSELDWPLTAR